MKKKMFLVLIIVALLFIRVNKVKADLTDFSAGATGSTSGMGSGDWCSGCVGLKISVVNSNGTPEDSEIILNNASLTNPHFSTETKPKTKQSTTINWTTSKTVYKSSLIPGDWDPNNVTINLHSMLTSNDYNLLKSLLELKKSDGSNIFTSLSSGDYILVEPMTKIGKYYGTAFELLNSLDDTTYKSYDSTWGTFTNWYSGAVFGGSAKYPNGGIFYTSLFLSDKIDALGLTYYGSSNDTEAAKTGNKLSYRNKCLKTSTCGRGIGVFKYDDVYPAPPAPPAPPPPKYTLDLNYCVDKKIYYELPRYPANFSYDFTINGQNSSSTYYLNSITSGTTYSISNITAQSDYIYKGYNVSDHGNCNINNTSTSVSGSVTSSFTSINFIFESSCDKRLRDIRQSNGTYNASDLFNLYKFYLDKSGNEKKDYRGLLNISNPSCTTKSAPSKEITNLTCLSASTLSHANFHEKDLSNYDEILTDASGNYVGFCLSSMYLKNNLGTQKFYAKSGQFLIKQTNNNSEIEIYNSNYNPIRVCGSDVATTTITKKCYVLSNRTPVNTNYTSTDHVTLYFGDNNNDTHADQLVKENNVIIKNGTTANTTTNTSLLLHEYKKEIKYKLNTISIQNISGKVVTGSNNIVNGVISTFNSKSGTIPFKITYKGKTYGATENLCTYESEQKIIQNDKLNLEFRIIDTKNPFKRNTMSNWSNGTDKSKDNNTVKKYIKDAVNSYGLDKNGNKVDQPKYVITLTPTDIKNIREYNKSVPYDNYDVDCSVDENENQVCRNIFLKNLENGKVIINDENGNIVKTLENTTKDNLFPEELNNTSVDNLNKDPQTINGVNITNKICTPVSYSANGNIPTGNYNIGDEYVCEVAPGVRYNFFVIGTCGDDKVNMIMNMNLVNRIAWISFDDYKNVGGSTEDWSALKYSLKGPITALNKLKEQTSNWSNIVSYNYTLIDEINDFSNYYKNLGEVIDSMYHPMAPEPDKEKYSPIEQEDVKARFLTRNEANSCGCGKYAENCPAFLTVGLVNGQPTTGYWLSNSSNTCYGSVDACASDINLDNGDYSTANRTDAGGIRPVITVYKSQISN